MTYDPQAALGIARHFADIGYHEGANNRNDFSAWQYGDFFEPWCDSFVCYCAWHAGFRFPAYSAWGEKGDSNVGAHHQHAQYEGIWRDRNYRASTGDLVIFNFTEPDQHIEIVDADWGDWLATVGGNTSDRVARRHRYRKDIVGFPALTLAGQGQTPKPPPPPIVWKVNPMYNPAINVLGGIRASLRVGNGELLAGPLGHLYALDGCPNVGGPIDSAGNPKPYWVGRQVAQLVLPNAAEKAAGKVYTVISNDGNRYAYPE